MTTQKLIVLLTVFLLLGSGTAIAATDDPKKPKPPCRLQISNAHISTSLLEKQGLRYSFRMDLDEPLILSPDEQLRVDQAVERFSNLLNSERSRYEIQARELIENQILVTDTDAFVLKYKINGDFYISRGNPKVTGGQSFSIEFPIPTTEQERIESLIELFAQSEAESSNRD